MNHKNLLAVAAIAMLPFGASALPANFFAKSSKLASGNWVKVGIGQTGVYEITYDQLREMGFSNPSNVSVFGRGGRMMAETFTDIEGKPLLDPDIVQVRVKHADNKLLFYGLGVEDVSFVDDPALKAGGHFKRNSKNMYSENGYYFLTDSSPKLSIETAAISSRNDMTPLTEGIGYVYHEQDLAQNNTGSGRLYWGESFFFGDPLKTWDVELPDLIGGGAGAMECVVYTSKNLNEGHTNPATQIWLGYGVGNSVKDGVAAANFAVSNQSNTSDYIPQEPTLKGFNIPAGTNKVFVDYQLGHSRGWDLSALDYWVLSYPKGIPTLKNPKGQAIGQDLIAFPSIPDDGVAYFEISEPANKTVWDVTDPMNPRELTVTLSGNKGIVNIERIKLEDGTETSPVLAIFDSSTSLNKISNTGNGWVKVPNQNLHALQAEGCDMAIITIPEMIDAAKELAEIHREAYDSKVIIVTTQELYNEFSGGVPDPMAYRSFVKMMYTSPGVQIKNLFLAGPLACDPRGIKVKRDSDHMIIAFQDYDANLENSAMNANDFYGMMTDYFNVNAIEKQEMHVGVGILPVYTSDEFRRYNKKVYNFVNDESFAYRLTSNVNIGGLLNNHIHAQQAVDFSEHLQNLTYKAAINTTICIDAYGNEQSLDKWVEAVNNGRHVSAYFGHGAATFLGQDRRFFTPAQIPLFKNKALGIMGFFGCTITDSDHGIRGLGEGMVLDTDHGLIGSLVATRSTWSGQNFDYAKQFFNSFISTNANSPYGTRETKPLTLGEVYAKSKNISLFKNELAYQLIADPGIIYPVVLQQISVSFPSYCNPGQTMKLSGSILKPGSSSIDTQYNGELVVRVLEPSFSLESEDLVSGSNSADLHVIYEDQQMSMTTARVINGKFEVEIFIPQQAVEHENRRMRFNFCAYNPKTKTGAATYKTATIYSAAQSVKPTPDTTAPVIEEMAYDPIENSIVLTASDNVALDLSRNMLAAGFQVYLDDRHFPAGSASQPVLTGDGPRRYTREFYIGDQSAGNHSLRVIVKDAAGNTTESEMTFTIGDDATLYNLSIRETALTDEVTLYVEGHSPKTATIFITDANGNSVLELPYRAGQNIKWDGKDSRGNRVAPGRYRVYLRETGSHQTKGHSSEIIVPVV